MRSAFAASGAAPPRHTIEAERGVNRRADLMGTYNAMRNGILFEEAELRDELFRTYQVYTEDAVAYSRRLPAIEAQRHERQQARSERDATKARLLSAVCIEDESEGRRTLYIDEERTRRRLMKQESCDLEYVGATLRLQLTIRCEDRKRYSLERTEAAAYEQLVTEYSQTPWKPTIKMLGQCPFARKTQCPFADRRKQCHGMPLDGNHYEHSAVDHVGADMM